MKMKNLMFVLLLAAASAFAQKTLTVCWTANQGLPDQGQQTCRMMQAGTVTMVTVDLRTPQYVVVQTLPAYVITAGQAWVSNQTYSMQQADGSLVVKPRWSSVQDWLMQGLLKGNITAALQLTPPTGADAGKTTWQAVMADVAAGMIVSPVQ